MDVTLVQECLHSRRKSSSNFYLTAFSYVNKTLIYSLSVQTWSFTIPFTEPPRFWSAVTKRTIF